jgi:hypothetical protein
MGFAFPAPRWLVPLVRPGPFLQNPGDETRYERLPVDSRSGLPKLPFAAKPPLQPPRRRFRLRSPSALASPRVASHPPAFTGSRHVAPLTEVSPDQLPRRRTAANPVVRPRLRDCLFRTVLTSGRCYHGQWPISPGTGLCRPACAPNRYPLGFRLLASASFPPLPPARSEKRSGQRRRLLAPRTCYNL